MTNPGYIQHKDKVLKRLTRIEGQIRGISRMVAADTYCIDVLTQVGAAQAALDKAALELLRDHARNCLTADTPADTAAAHAAQQPPADARADELVDAVSRLLKR